jgi:hypothetical protein
VRRVLVVRRADVAALRLDTPEGRDAFRRARLADPEDWTAELHAHPAGSVLVLDYVGAKPPHQVRTMRVGGAHPHDGLRPPPEG